MVLGQDRRLLVFGPHGERVRSGRVEGGGTLGYFGTEGMLDPQRVVLFRSGGGGGSDDGWIESRIVYMVSDLSDGTVDTLTTVEARGGWHRMNYGLFPIPFEAGSHVAAGAGQVWIGRSEDRYEIRSWDASATPRMIVRNARQPTEVTTALQRQYREWQMQTRGRGAGGRQRINGWHRIIRFPAEFAAYKDLAVDPEGYLWVLRYEPPWARTDFECDVYDPDGRWLGVVAMPYEASPSCRREVSGCLTIEIGRDYLIVRDTDDFDASRVKVYGLRR